MKVFGILSYLVNVLLALQVGIAGLAGAQKDNGEYPYVCGTALSVFILTSEIIYRSDKGCAMGPQLPLHQRRKGLYFLWRIPLSTAASAGVCNSPPKVLHRIADTRHCRLWLDIFQKLRATGFNAVSIYFFWAYHAPNPETYDFETGAHDVQRYISINKKPSRKI